MNKWKHTGYLMHIVIFVDTLSLMGWLSLSLQHDKHNPVKVTRHLNEFTWTVEKLCLIIENSLNEDDAGQVKSCFKTCSKVKNDDGEFSHQGIRLAKLELTIKQIPVQYQIFALKLGKGFLCLWSLFHLKIF